MMSAIQFKPDTDDWRAVRALNGYRWLVAITAGVLFVSGLASELFTIMWPALFGGACLAYLILCLLSALITYRPVLALPTQLYLLIGTDTAFVLALVFATGGVRDGLAMLLFAPIAGASILVPPRIAALFAAVASIGLLLEEGWRYLTYSGAGADWAPAGILGLLLFAVAVGASILSRRARVSAAMAARHKSDLDDMTRLNERIVHQMALGLLVVDSNGRIRMSNQAAHDSLGIEGRISGTPLITTAPNLENALRSWQLAPDRPTKPFTAGDNRLIPHFNDLDTTPEAPVLIFLNDARRLNEQAQQIKLAALGRLTASIAHEIRNPLSAISQAGQLLDESDNIGDDERNLLAILHRHTGRVDEIVQDILGLSRHGNAALSPIALGTWLPQFVVEYQQGRAHSAMITIGEIDPQLEVRADRRQLTQVLTNLCENAERHAGKAAHEVGIQISAGYSARDQPWLMVADNGPGIADEMAEKLMEPFFTTAHDGTGLGLYIARELCESNFADLALVETDRGACFRITFARPDQLQPATANTANQ